VLLTEDPVDCVMVASDHAWASRAWVTAADLAEEPFVFVERRDAPRVYDAVMQGFAEIGLSPAFGPTASGPRAVWRCVADGLGWTIGSRSQRSNPPHGLAPVPVEGLHISWGIALLWRRDESDPLVRQVLDVFRETRNPDVPVVVATVRAAYGAASVTAV
jgi:DNA-binding transcriptional LysR family regulator